MLQQKKSQKGNWEIISSLRFRHSERILVTTKEIPKRELRACHFPTRRYPQNNVLGYNKRNPKKGIERRYVHPVARNLVALGLQQKKSQKGNWELNVLLELRGNLPPPVTTKEIPKRELRVKWGSPIQYLRYFKRYNKRNPKKGIERLAGITA